MDIKEKILGYFRKKLPIAKPEKVGYINCDCPGCKTHIGTGVYKLRGDYNYEALCPKCGRNVFLDIPDGRMKIYQLRGIWHRG